MAEATTLGPLAQGSAGESAALQLAIIDSGRLTFFSLPREGTVLIGRGQHADVRLEDPRVSRDHARLHLGEATEIEDLGSANGTLVQNRLIPKFTRISISPTQGIGLGNAVIVIQPLDVQQQIAAASDQAPRMKPASPPDGIVLLDEQMRRLYEMAARVALGQVSVLILGETGTGKELLAETIHRSSPRASKDFLCINCATLSESLLESELFGYEKGAFTGAQQSKAGLLESAPGGTVFLDEVGEMTAATQSKLLRALEARQILRVGGTKPRPIDVRFVSATNRNLVDEVARGQFRRDLYFRLNTVTLEIPPLRERGVEIAPLAQRFAAAACSAAGRKIAPRFTDAAIQELEAYPWPGNVRELRSIVERAVLLCEREISPQHLALKEARRLSEPLLPRSANDGSSEASLPASRRAQPETREAATSSRSNLRVERATLERRRIKEALDLFGGNQTRAAQYLGISRRTLLNRLDEYGYTRPRKRNARSKEGARDLRTK